MSLLLLWLNRAWANPVDFNIAAQPADTALMAFSKQAQVEVLFSSDDVRLCRSNELVGRFEPAEALGFLLQGTGFGYKKTKSGKFIVRRNPKGEDGPASTPPSQNNEPKNNPGINHALNDGDVIRLSTLIITPSHYGVSGENTSQNVTMTSADLQPLPQIGEDLYRTINRMPGLSANDYTARFLVRGAPNSQVLSRCDGIDLIEPFHLKEYDGALSIIDLDTVGSINLITGGFTAEYGNHLAGVFNIETKSTPEEMKTVFGLSITGIRASNEGSFNKGNGHWMASARRGYIDLALKLGGNEVKDTPIYYDATAKLDFRLGPNNVLSFHVLHAGDEFESRNNNPPDPDLSSSYGSTYLWTRWLANPDERITGETVLSYSHISWDRFAEGKYDEVDIGALHPLTMRDRRRFDTTALRSDWTFNLSEDLLLKSGFEARRGEARYDYQLNRLRYSLANGELGTEWLERDVHIRPDGNQLGAFLALRLRLGKTFLVEPGARYDHASWTDDSEWSPRLNLSQSLGKATIRAAWGVYREPRRLHELSVQDGEAEFRKSEKAEHRIIGISFPLGQATDLRLEAYERLTSRINPYWVNLIDPFEPVPESLYDRRRIAPAKGRARGVEMSIRRRGAGRFGWGASYAYAINEHLINNRWTPCYWDQRHTFYADITFVPAPNWQLSAAWQIHSGWPYTDQNFHIQQLNNNTLTYTWEYGSLNSLRAPTYHRLDIRATRTYRFRTGVLRAYVDIWNVYDRANSVGFDNHHAYLSNNQLIVVKSTGKMLSILPNAGVTWEF